MQAHAVPKEAILFVRDASCGGFVGFRGVKTDSLVSDLKALIIADPSFKHFDKKTMSLRLVAYSGEDEPTFEDAQKEANSLDLSVSTWPLAKAVSQLQAKVPGTDIDKLFFVVSGPQAASNGRVTLQVRTISGELETLTFESEAAFDRVTQSCKLRHMQAVGEGAKDRRISILTSLDDAVAASKDTSDGKYLLLDDPMDKLFDDVSSLKRAGKNHATGIEVQTTLAIAQDPVLREKLGELTVMNAAQGVKVIDDVAKVAYKKALAEHKKKVAQGEAEAKDAPKAEYEFECDGLVKNTTVLVVNEAKATASKESVDQVCQYVDRLRELLKRPSEFSTVPEHVLGEVEGLGDVVPVLSGFSFPPDVQKAAREKGVYVLRTTGEGYAVPPSTE